MSPSKNISFADMLADLKLVLGRDEFTKAQNDVLNLIAELMKDCEDEHRKDVPRSP